MLGTCEFLSCNRAESTRHVLLRDSDQTCWNPWPIPLLVFFGFDFEIFNHFSEKSHCEEATFIVLGDQSSREKH